MQIDVTGKDTVAVLGSVLGQSPAVPDIAPAPDFTLYRPPPTSYSEAWERLMSECQRWLGETDCRRLLGYTPFVCPVPSERPLTAQPWFWLALGITAGIVGYKLLL